MTVEFENGYDWQIVERDQVLDWGFKTKQEAEEEMVNMSMERIPYREYSLE